MKKRVCGILLAALTLAGVNISEARAEVYEGAEGWEVSFTGNGMESSFKSSELSDAASALQPGDGITFRIVLKNEYSGGTDWYMANEVLSSLEDSQSIGRGSGHGGREQDFCRIHSAGGSFRRRACLLCLLDKEEFKK